jgi:probable HAF family extracellular repeat protein
MKRSSTLLAEVAFLAVLFAGISQAVVAVEVHSLTNADGSLSMGSVGGLSADGSALTGSRWSLQDYLPETFRWVAGSNVVEITPGGISSNLTAYASMGWGISDNRQVIVGWKHEGQPGAFAWVNGAAVSLSSVRGSAALGLSRDGSIAVGRNPTTTLGSSIQAVSWSTASGTATVLPDLTGGATLATARAISADKSTIVGWGTDAEGRKATRWVGGAVTALGDLPGGKVFAEATAVSGDGSVIVGRSWSSNGIEAFRWTAATGMQALGDLPGGCHQSEATGVSDDGLTIVGKGESDLGPEVFLWSATNGLRSLRTLLKAAGQDMSGWSFSGTRPVLSGDGNVLAGEAVDPDQNFVLFRVSGLRELTNCLVSTVMAWRADGADMVLRFQTEPGLRYQLETAADLNAPTWETLGMAVIGTGADAEVRCPKPVAEERQFYRLVVINGN